MMQHGEEKEMEKRVQDKESSPFTQEMIERMTRPKNYQELASCATGEFELFHGIVHTFIGGTMVDLPHAAYDPLFWWGDRCT